MSRIHLKTGSEGPLHDPYHFTELTVTRADGSEVTIHTGLLMWVDTPDGKRHQTDDSTLADLFEQHAGIPPWTAERAYHERKARLRRFHSCGPQHLDWVNGFPGETLLICRKCNAVIDSHFDRSAIE